MVDNGTSDNTFGTEDTKYGSPPPIRAKKLIETGIPLKTINAESVREKSLRHGLPNTLHLYWSRKPLATTRSILFAQLVDDPSAHPDRFPTQEAQEQERSRLYMLMERLAVWENVNDKDLYREARQAILDSNDGVMPVVLDPFAGGGAIPLEAQRLGMESHASDLNPLAVIINKALIEFPSRFHGMPSMHPTDIADRNGAGGLADDIRYYGAMLRDITYAKVGHLYPKVRDELGNEHTVIAWKWARTVTNPNPANPVQVPLVNSWWLSKKSGHEAWVKPIVGDDGTIRYEVRHDANGPTGDDEGTVNRKGAISIVDGTPVDLKYIREEARSGRMSASLICAIADGGAQGRVYISPDDEQMRIADVGRPDDVPMAELPEKALGFRVQAYGFRHWSDLFTNRQLTVLTTLADTVAEVREQVLADARAKGMPEGERLDDGGSGALAYADTIAVYLALAVSRQTDRCSSIASWQNIGEKVRNVFARQAIPMTWDYAEVNPFSSSSGCFSSQINWVAEAVENLPATPPGEAHQADAATRDYTGVVVSTDPPYYDNIGYSDLSDYFYVWLRPMLADVLPSVTATTMTPKAQELVANPYRHGGRDGAARFFTDGFNHVFAHIRETANTDVPMTVYYAYKQKSDTTGVSTGWHTLLEGLIHSGWQITATWPLRSERAGRMLSVGTNALASSIVLACRPRPEDAPATTMRMFTAELRSELTDALHTLMDSGVDPVDLKQAAIGPGIGVYSRYSRIREADGSDMPITKALEAINRMVDEVLGEEDTDYDSETRFAVQWYRSCGWAQTDYGTAEQLALSCGTTPAELVYSGVFEAAGGRARLLRASEMTSEWNPSRGDHVSLWGAMIRMVGALGGNGTDAVVPIMAKAGEYVSLDQVRNLSFRMYHEAERRKDTDGAIGFNNLVSVWDDAAGTASMQVRDRVENTQGVLDIG